MLFGLFAFGHALPAVGSGDSLARAASELEPPVVRGVRRTMVILAIYGGLLTIGSTFLFVSLVPERVQDVWSDVPLLGKTLGVHFDRVDLDFILQQIKTAEAHQPPVAAPLAFGLRTVSGEGVATTSSSSSSIRSPTRSSTPK